MPSLIVACPHCTTWVETGPVTGANRCTECGANVELNEPDLDHTSWSNKFGEWICDLGTIRLERKGWPSHGRFIITTTGFLFLPSFVVRSNGALEPVQFSPSTSTSWREWIQQLSTTFLATFFYEPTIPTQNASDPFLSESYSGQPGSKSLVERFFDAPGSSFVSFKAIKRIQVRNVTLQIFRNHGPRVDFKSAVDGKGIHIIATELRKRM